MGGGLRPAPFSYLGAVPLRAAPRTRRSRRMDPVVTRFAPKRDLHMLPYSAKRTKLIGRMLKLVYGRGKRD